MPLKTWININPTEEWSWNGIKKELWKQKLCICSVSGKLGRLFASAPPQSSIRTGKKQSGLNSCIFDELNLIFIQTLGNRKQLSSDVLLFTNGLQRSKCCWTTNKYHLRTQNYVFFPIFHIIFRQKSNKTAECPKITKSICFVIYQTRLLSSNVTCCTIRKIRKKKHNEKAI